MVALKTADIEKFLARPDPARPVVLVFGPDAGLVSERVNALIKASVDDVNDPFSLVRLEAEELSANPARLVEEAQTIPLFGGRRAVWAKAGSRNIAPAVEAVLALPTSECRVVIEAGDLRRNAPLRVVCERAKNAAALPCYADTERDLARLIDTEMREAELTLKPEARAMLIPLLGGDRAASRSELRKLALTRAAAAVSTWTMSPRWSRMRRRWRSTSSSIRPSRDVQSSSKLSLQRCAPPAARSARSSLPRSASSRSCTDGAWRSKAVRTSPSIPCSRRCISGAKHWSRQH